MITRTRFASVLTLGSLVTGSLVAGSLVTGSLVMGSLAGCDGGSTTPPRDAGPRADAQLPPPPPPSCNSSGGSSAVAEPELLATLSDRWHEGWLASPAVADLDGDGENEIVLGRHGMLIAFHLDNSVVFRVETDGDRIWSSPVVSDLVPERAGLEVAFAARERIYMVGASGEALPGFPYTGRDELRSIAAGDIDGDDRYELVSVCTTRLEAGGQRDILIAVNEDGTAASGFPPNTTGASGCDDACYVTGGYDQNIALGDLDGDGDDEVFAGQDNAYLSLHEGNGRAFDCAPIFRGRTKFLGVRFLHDYAEAQQGYADDEATALQAHFTNSAPAIADLNGDGQRELIILGSVQNAAQDDRLQGVGLWAIHPDGTRPADWTAPFHAPDYLAGLWDYDGTNVVGATNQVSVAELFPDRAGPELVFAGFDGRIHCVDSRAQQIWQSDYTTSDRVLTGGVAIADLSGDGTPEIVFATYSPDMDRSHLFVMAASGQILHRVALPMRGSMTVPTIADVNGNGDLEIVVDLKDGEDRMRSALVYTVPGSGTECLLWPTGRGNLLRNGFVP
ncbi:MAG: VCBS repeat-containing protein [Sandaracinaceae bacterium]|nr:VCBS repeat-containing protein [Sandaracinaceae bacterium]